MSLDFIGNLKYKITWHGYRKRKSRPKPKWIQMKRSLWLNWKERSNWSNSIEASQQVPSLKVKRWLGKPRRPNGLRSLNKRQESSGIALFKIRDIPAWLYWKRSPHQRLISFRNPFFTALLPVIEAQSDSCQSTEKRSRNRLNAVRATVRVRVLQQDIWQIPVTVLFPNRKRLIFFSNFAPVDIQVI